MFDDIQPPKSGSTPNNLPLGEPEDIFERTDASAAVPNQDASISEPSVSQNTALDAGVLKPKNSLIENPVQIAQDISAQAAVPKSAPTPVPQPYTIQTPSSPFLTEQQGMGQAPQEAPFSARKIFVFIAIVLIIGLLGFGSFYIYTKYIKTDIGENAFPSSTTSVETNTPDSTDTTNVPPVTTPNPTSTNTENSILFGEPADTDSDGIIDIDEAKYGTNTLNWDTDGDGLPDGDEVLIWKTNPLVADTDSDGYSDSEEIRNGYNPLGTGKLFEPPTTTPESSTTTP